MATKSNDIKSKLQAHGATVIDGKSANIVADNIEAFKALLCSPELRNRVVELFPCAFADGELQMDALLQSMGQYADNVEDHESYPISWRGKAEAEKRAQTMTTATLRPCIEESVGKDGQDGVFDSQNLYIEGDNLEVLKVLERSYANAIDIIYIDPPYNTGNDFIWKDKYADGLNTYLEYTAQMDDTGNKITSKRETNGALHSKWLSMMYPRLLLAKQLLTQSGVIFINIDEIEYSNLKKLCDDVFGQECHIGTFIWISKLTGGHDSKNVNTVHEYILAYSNSYNDSQIFNLIQNHMDYPLVDEKGRIYKLDSLWTVSHGYTKNCDYPIYVNKETMEIYTSHHDNTIEIFPWMCHKNRERSKGIARWYWSKETFINDYKLLYAKKQGGDIKIYKRIYSDSGIPTLSTLFDKEQVGGSSRGKDEIEILFGQSIFPHPKSTFLVTELLQLYPNHQGLKVLDFFSGSGTTAHTIIKLNINQQLNREFILVQLPEPCNSKTPEGKAALEAGFKNIAEIGKERIRRAGRAIKKEHPEANIDIGFKVFKLDSSNLKKWDDKAVEDVKEVSNRLLGAQDMMVPGRSHLDVVYEYMLKYGLTLDWPVECVKVHHKDVYVVAGGMFMVCLDHDLDKEWAKELVQLKKKLDPADWRVLVADESFGNETNTRDNNAQNIFHTLCDAGLAPVNFIIA